MGFFKCKINIFVREKQRILNINDSLFKNVRIFNEDKLKLTLIFN